MTHDEFAETLGVARRTVASWHARPDVVLRAELQRIFDTALEQSSAQAKARFGRHLDDSSAQGSEHGVVFTVAIAVVTHKGDVLLVCRRDDAAGLTWQFPAGVVKPGASADRVAVRETLAETGVHCMVRENLGGRLHPATGVRCEYFLCEYLAGDLENLDVDENESVIWVPRSDVTRFIPVGLIFPPVLHALSEDDLRERSA